MAVARWFLGVFLVLPLLTMGVFGTLSGITLPDGGLLLASLAAGGIGWALLQWLMKHA